MHQPLHIPGKFLVIAMIALIPFTISSCEQQPSKTEGASTKGAKSEKPEYFLLRAELEKKYGYTQAVKVGNIVKVGGVISIDDNGSPMAKNDYQQQMKNCYASLEKVLKHYGAGFDDVILENIYTTSMAELQKNASYRQQIYTRHFPTGSWIGVKELGMPETMIEIEIEALIPNE
ncbi:RidA family protein [Chitinophaga pendula]|uniref:RidA family protein n=1 Tax=Chitinophaga TaxID=79328 RepID=UPI000BAEEE9D|nr:MULTISPECIES: RidA family protein [Chitinophaga]ASZ12476.1 enamine deaminase RidA [Chitinophaga sp. MD30]UCJ09923.1 RidA family protein [Chitinophaga pendula]